MTNFWGAVSTIGTLIFFIGVVFWALSKKRDETFNKAARMPMEDNDVDNGSSQGTVSEDKLNG